MTYLEEPFGILTDDNLYLDCILVKPPNLTDPNTRGLRVWVPKVPLSKASLIACARQEVTAQGADGQIAHLIFDLRGTGESDYKDSNYEMDLRAIRAWTEERFGNIPVNFYGFPTIENGRVYLLPVRPAVVIEHYVYSAIGKPTTKTILYLATYGNFTPADENLCMELAKAGYHVYAMDPLRYMLHASAVSRLSPEDLWADLRFFIPTLPGAPIILAQPIAAGLGIVWASGIEEVAGIIAIGRTQVGFRPAHIFKNENPHTFMAGRYARRISPRPLVLVLDGRARREDADELATIYQMSAQPCKLERATKIDVEFLLKQLAWIEKP